MHSFIDPNMPKEDYRLISEKLTFQFFEKGQVVFNHGDFGSQFYIILRGRASINVPMNKSSNKTNKKVRIKTDKLMESKYDESTLS